jgi:hypothetical protein
MVTVNAVFWVVSPRSDVSEGRTASVFGVDEQVKQESR